MADDGLSASELRRRYGPGGSAPDSELSAAQLRARHNVQNREFRADDGGGVLMYVVAGIALIVFLAIMYVLMAKQGAE
ncbi:unnamed protein product [Vitrella brassicaformis CCMP3155]|uniref:Cation-transporting P-type ATPase N-terminal domain-containing protein n=2 Tax=Vitrella brassicaformis TaxID=1169539 RepID=A0A0G4H4G1_VITBC|nr:unnamed protein product [Vitrella brassicaformis CCMP3155]|eukprot:CEM38406.1 unnamed protein product [Vitrella brassicaformis CCMP3155]